MNMKISGKESSLLCLMAQMSRDGEPKNAHRDEICSSLSGYALKVAKAIADQGTSTDQHIAEHACEFIEWAKGLKK